MAEPSGPLLFLILFVGVLLVIALLWLISRTKALLRGEPFLTAQRFQRAGGSVKSFEGAAPSVMSREEDRVPQISPSALRTDDGRTETTAQTPKFTEDQLLTLYRLLREQKTSRDRAAQVLKLSGIPMNNNLWAKAAPSPAPTTDDDDVLVTPIAGRRTSRRFYPENPELEFQEPPN